MLATNLRIEGGNLISNGRGICITTQQVLDANADHADEATVREWMQECYGAEQAVFLEPLSGEPTGHVDMFATFVSPYTVVVGRFDVESDPINAALLDRNADRLARVTTPDGPLRVVRIPMPPHDEETWRTYTNVVFANGVLMVPIYPELDPAGRDAALETFSRVLPGWRIIGMNATRLAELGGAMHCITMNLGPLTELPQFARPQRILAEAPSPADRPLPPQWQAGGDAVPSATDDLLPQGDELKRRLLNDHSVHIFWQRDGWQVESLVR